MHITYIVLIIISVSLSIIFSTIFINLKLAVNVLEVNPALENLLSMHYAHVTSWSAVSYNFGHDCLHCCVIIPLVMQWLYRMCFGCVNKINNDIRQESVVCLPPLRNL